MLEAPVFKSLFALIVAFFCCKEYFFPSLSPPLQLFCEPALVFHVSNRAHRSWTELRLLLEVKHPAESPACSSENSVSSILGG